jgi:trans-aconitate methyltransferase
MSNFINNWKNKKVFEKQLELNKSEFNNSYPQHWFDFLNTIKSLNISSILDVGCGSGIYYKLCKKELPNINYFGVDYSIDAIKIAKREYSETNFDVKSINDLTEDYLNQFDLIHLGAVLDVLPNGDEVFERILNLKPKKLFIGRIKFTHTPSNYIEYKAYDEIMTYEYRHNLTNFTNLSKKYNYTIKFESNNVLLTYEPNK